MDGFLRSGFATLTSAVHDASTRAGLHLAPETITRRTASALRVRLRLLEALLRQLLMLLAAALDLPALRSASTPQERRDRPAPARRSFRLMPDYRFDGAAFEKLKARPAAAPPDDTPVIPLRHRLETLQRLLEDPAAAARRMARRLARMKARGDFRPVCFPFERLHRLPTELGLLASYTPTRVNDVMRAWFAAAHDPPPDPV